MKSYLDRISLEASRRPSMHLAWPDSSGAYNRLVHSADSLGNAGIDKRHLFTDM